MAYGSSAVVTNSNSLTFKTQQPPAYYDHHSVHFSPHLNPLPTSADAPLHEPRLLIRTNLIYPNVPQEPFYSGFIQSQCIEVIIAAKSSIILVTTLETLLICKAYKLHHLHIHTIYKPSHRFMLHFTSVYGTYVLSLPLPVFLSPQRNDAKALKQRLLESQFLLLLHLCPPHNIS